MNKKINTKFVKLIKYYSLINHNLIYDTQSINRYKSKDLMAKGSKKEQLKKIPKLQATWHQKPPK